MPETAAPTPTPAPPKRHDPPSRPVDGDINTAAWLTNTDPNRVYCLADPNDRDSGRDHLMTLEHPWEVEIARKDGPKIRGGQVSTDGSALMVRGAVVMSRSKESHEAYLRSVYEVADRHAKAIGQAGGVDAVRSADGRLAQFAQDPREYLTRG